MNDNTQVVGSGGGYFPTTIPALLDNSGSPDTGISQSAWDDLVWIYWQPIYSYLRVRHQKAPEDAKDLTQDFFFAVVEKNYFKLFDIRKARFRTFLRCCIDRFVLNDHKHSARLKRGGGSEHLSVELLDQGEDLELSDNMQSHAAFFEREWVRSVFEQALAAFVAECNEKDRAQASQLFERYYLSGETSISYEDLANQFSLTTSDITNRLAGARRDFRRILLDHLKSTSFSRERVLTLSPLSVKSMQPYSPPHWFVHRKNKSLPRQPRSAE
jgi:RNA polymerase sigma factor (sigma-70 family)